MLFIEKHQRGGCRLYTSAFFGEECRHKGNRGWRFAFLPGIWWVQVNRRLYESKGIGKPSVPNKKWNILRTNSAWARTTSLGAFKHEEAGWSCFLHGMLTAFARNLFSRPNFGEFFLTSTVIEIGGYSPSRTAPPNATQQNCIQGYLLLYIIFAPRGGDILFGWQLLVYINQNEKKELNHGNDHLALKGVKQRNTKYIMMDYLL